MSSLGFHIHKKKRKTTYNAIVEDVELYCINAAQIYVLNSQSGVNIKLENKPNEIKEFVSNKIDLIVHASHITNGFWNEDDVKKEKKGINLLLKQMEIADSIGAKWIVLHIPKKKPKYIFKRLNKYADKINEMNSAILLEHHVYKPDKNTSYEMPSKLNKLTDIMKDSKLRKWGYTIDTAHIWSSISEDDRVSGYTIESSDGAKKWIKGLSKNTKNKVKLIHLNGSHNKNSCNKDKHAIPIYGVEEVCKGNKKEKIIDNIWSSYTNPELDIKTSGIYRFVKFAKKYDIMLIIEMNYGKHGDLKKSLNRISNILKKLKK